MQQKLIHHCKSTILQIKIKGPISSELGFLGSSVVKNLHANAADTEIWVWSLGWEDTLEKEMATHSNILAWEVLWIEEPCGLQSMGSQSTRHHWVTEKTGKYTEINIVNEVLKRKHSYSLPFWKKKYLCHLVFSQGILSILMYFCRLRLIEVFFYSPNH